MYMYIKLIEILTEIIKHCYSDEYIIRCSPIIASKILLYHRIEKYCNRTHMQQVEKSCPII